MLDRLGGSMANRRTVGVCVKQEGWSRSNAPVELQGDHIRERAERALSIAALTAPTPVREQAR